MRVAASSGSDEPTALLNLDCAFVFEPVEVKIEDDDMLTPKAAFLVRKMMTGSNGLAFSRLQLPLTMFFNHSIDVAHNTQELGHMIEQVLCASERRLEDVVELDEVILSCPDPWSPDLGRLLSAVSESRTIKKLTLPLDIHSIGDLRTWTWERVAYALFSPQARTRSSITEVALSGCDMSLQDAEAIANVLASDDPVRYLFGRGRGSGDPNGPGSDRSASETWMLKRGAIVTLLPMHAYDHFRSYSASWTLPTEVHGVKILGVSVGSQLPVLVPGYGVCEVNRDDLHSVGDTDGPDRRQGGVASLQLEFFGDDALAGLPRFLEVVGSSLKRLEIEIESDEDMDVQRILRACPNLDTLIIRGPRVATAPLLEAYRVYGCRVSEINCCFSDLSMITRELSDKNSNLVRTLNRGIQVPV